MSTTTPEAVKSNDKPSKPAKTPKEPKAKAVKQPKETIVLEKGEASLADLVFDPQFQMRHDKVDANEYAEALVESKGKWIFPPLKVCVVKNKKYVVEGFTRGAAAHIYLEQLAKANKGTKDEIAQLEQRTFIVPIEFRQATMRQALIEALGANSDHGFRRTNADKRKAVATALAQMPGSSAEKIAEICKVSPPFVYKLRAKLANPEKAEPTEDDVRKSEQDHKANVEADTTEAARKAAEPKPSKQDSKPTNLLNKPSTRQVTPREKALGTCPNCGSPFWDEHNDGNVCAECLHPHGEAVGSSGDEEDVTTPDGKRLSNVPATVPSANMVDARLVELNKLTTGFGGLVRDLEKVGLYAQLKVQLDAIQVVLMNEKSKCRKSK